MVIELIKKMITNLTRALFVSYFMGLLALLVIGIGMKMLYRPTTEMAYCLLSSFYDREGFYFVCSGYDETRKKVLVVEQDELLKWCEDGCSMLILNRWYQELKDHEVYQLDTSSLYFVINHRYINLCYNIAFCVQNAIFAILFYLLLFSKAEKTDIEKQ